MKRFVLPLLPLLAIGALFWWTLTMRAPSPPPLSGPAASGKPTIAATIPPAGALLRELAGDRLRVTTLLRPGDSPHTVEPSPQTVAQLSGCVALVFVGSGLDDWAARLPARQRASLMALLPKASRLDADPHFWMDPLAVAAISEPLATALARWDPDGAPVYRANAQRLIARMNALHAELSQTLAPARGRGAALYHPGMRYFLRRYGIVCLGVVERSPDFEPSARDLAALREKLRLAGAPRVLLASRELSPQQAQASAEALDARAVFVDELGGTPGRETLAGLLRENARVVREALTP